MSIHVLAQAVENTLSQKMTRFVLISVCDAARKDGLSMPTLKEIQDWTGFSRRAVQSALKELRDLGELVVVEPSSRGRGTLYRVMVGLPSWQSQKGCISRTLIEKREREIDALRSMKGCKPCGASPAPQPKGVQTTQNGVQTTHPSHIEVRARDSTVPVLHCTGHGRDDPHDDPRKVAGELYDILRIENTSRAAASWHLAEHDVVRWQGWGASSAMILDVGRAMAARGKRNLVPKYLDGPISDAIQTAARERPTPNEVRPHVRSATAELNTEDAGRRVLEQRRARRRAKAQATETDGETINLRPIGDGRFA